MAQTSSSDVFGCSPHMCQTGAFVGKTVLEIRRGVRLCDSFFPSSYLSRYSGMCLSCLHGYERALQASSSPRRDLPSFPFTSSSCNCPQASRNRLAPRLHYSERFEAEARVEPSGAP